MEFEAAVAREVKPARACAHDVVVHLGSDGGATFRRCEACGAVLIAQGRRTYAVGGAKSRV